MQRETHKRNSANIIQTRKQVDAYYIYNSIYKVHKRSDNRETDENIWVHKREMTKL